MESIFNKIKEGLKSISRPVNPTLAFQSEILSQPKIVKKQKTLNKEIQIPDDNGGLYTIPLHSDTQVDSDDLYRNLGDIGMEDEFARVLRHPNQQTYSQDEINRFGKENYNRGENPDFSYGLMEAPNSDGTYDYGVGRTNSATFEDMKKNAFWGSKMKEKGLNTVQDLADKDKALQMSRLQIIRDNYQNYLDSMNEDGTVTNWKTPPRFGGYYAAPLDLRY